MIITTILVNVFSESVKQTIFYIFNLLSKSETEDKPKPMVLINDKPIIWHLMNIFSLQGFNEFIISTGFKSQVIENWVRNNEIVDAKYIYIGVDIEVKYDPTQTIETNTSLKDRLITQVQTYNTDILNSFSKYI